MSISLPEAKAFDLEAVLSIARIREYTKTDDVPHVTDDMLRFHRQVAFEAAELYTGQLFTQQKAVTEPTSADYSSRTLRRGFYMHRTRYPVADGRVFIYGGTALRPEEFMVEPGERNIRVPVTRWAIDADPCCAPRCSGALNHGMRIMYRAGFNCAADVPAGIILGCLKYVAWLVSNPGDEILTIRNRESTSNTGIIGTNNGAVASGAVEVWRSYSVEP